LLNTGILLDYHWHSLARIWRTPLLGELALAPATWPAFRTLFKHRSALGLPPAAVERMVTDFDAGTRRAVLRLYRATPLPSPLTDVQAATLRSLDRPALVVWGECDPFLPFRLAERQREPFPSAKVVGLSGSGHWPFLDDPEGVAQVVVPFLRHQLQHERAGTGA
jgi:pimeloyl-ACP methyl ester carboxylesterase